MVQIFRLPDGGKIDRSKPISVTFNNQHYAGYSGDTLASLLLANGRHLVGRSFKYHRPRGIFSAGPEEPNALVQLGDGARSEPNRRATEVEVFDGLTASSINAWPSVDFDLGAINNKLAALLPSGFYYKTFMWPASAWMRYEHFIRQAAGLGHAPEVPDADHYDKCHAHCDVLVVGAGPAGLAAALAAARSGARVVLADEQPDLGGQLLSRKELIDGDAALDWVHVVGKELAAAEEVRILTRTTAFAYYDGNHLGLLENVADHLVEKPEHLPRHRLWKLRAKQVVLATGAIERPLVFADNDRPGCMLAGACRSYVNRYAVRPGRRAVVYANNDDAYDAVLDLSAAGMEIVAVVDVRDFPEGPKTDRAKAQGLPILAGHVVIATHGKQQVTGVEVAPLSKDGRKIFGAGERLACDLVASSGGWSPTVHLFSQSKGQLAYDKDLGCFRPKQAVQAQRSAGACNATFGLKSCLDEGFFAGEKAAADAGFATKGRRKKRPQASDDGLLPARWLWHSPVPALYRGRAKQFVDLQNDVIAADLRLAVQEGYRSVEHVKRYTTTGMGTDQGKTGNVNALGIVAEALGSDISEIGVTTFRPPYTPVSFGAMAGRDLDHLLDPVRKTAMHAWHVRAGAKFEDVGQWKRPWYYPIEDETMEEAVGREVQAVRRSLGILDASTLGKIDIQGPDAAEFLNRIYTNAWMKLPVGRCRYGLMLGEDGMVMDDGVTARLGEDHFLMTTTTGNAAPVLAHLEEWLQTEWPELKVYMTSVTEQYATLQIAGPKARVLLSELVEDIDLSGEAFEHMSWREGKVAGVPARVFRISFTGELSYEVNVPASYGLSVWQMVMTVGQKYDITPFGTEAMHVLRAEKGFIIVGQETDGSITPIDLGMDWIVSKKKDFIGRRSLARSDMAKPDRKQLVGLETDDPQEVLPEGAQLVETVNPQPPMTMVGHVTSSYMSPNCGRSIALALVRGGRDKMGHRLFAPLAGGKTIACTIRDTVFFDPEGERLRG